MREMDVRVWLFRHGFTPGKSENHFVAMVEDHQVQIQIVDGSGKTSATHGKKRVLLREYDVADVRLGRHRMLHGAGIGNYFRGLMNLGLRAPGWFPKEYKRSVELAMSDHARNDRDWACSHAVLDWGIANGFKRVAHRILRGVVEGALTEIEVGIDYLTIRRLDADNRFVVREVAFREGEYIPSQILSGVGPADGGPKVR